MRLIDADALMKELDEYIDDYELGISDIKELINEVPTYVPEKSKGIMTNEQAKAWLEGLKANEKLSAAKEALDIAIKSIEDKPQGEWIDYSEEGFIECPFCHKATNCDDNKDELHYCWYCGAKMGTSQKKIRLIDADEAKKALEAHKYSIPTEINEFLNSEIDRTMAIIDEVPTVEERLQGKWIDKMETEGYVVCPFCGKEITGGDLNFCVKCGADMRKGHAK